MTVDALDPLIHIPARLRIVVTLAALNVADALSFTRLQDMIGPTPGNLITHLLHPASPRALSAAGSMLPSRHVAHSSHSPPCHRA